MQSSSSILSFTQVLIGASPITDASGPNASCPRSSDRSERHHAKVDVAGATPAVDAILPLCLQQQQGEFRKLVWWPRANARCESDQGLEQDCGVTSSISPCEGDGPGAN